MTGGSSGGPWLLNLGVDAAGNGVNYGTVALRVGWLCWVSSLPRSWCCDSIAAALSPVPAFAVMLLALPRAPLLRARAGHPGLHTRTRMPLSPGFTRGVAPLPPPKRANEQQNAVVGVTSWGYSDGGVKLQGASTFATNTQFPSSSYGSRGAGNIAALVEWACDSGPWRLQASGYCR
jgi:hypothetical protein